MIHNLFLSESNLDVEHVCQYQKKNNYVKSLKNGKKESYELKHTIFSMIII